MNRAPTVDLHVGAQFIAPVRCIYLLKATLP